MKNKQTNDYLDSNRIFFSELFNPARETKIIPKLTNTGVKYHVNEKYPKGLIAVVIGVLPDKRRLIQVYIMYSGIVKDSNKLITPNNNPILHIDQHPDFVDFFCISVSFILSPIFENNCFILTFGGLLVIETY